MKRERKKVGNSCKKERVRGGRKESKKKWREEIKWEGNIEKRWGQNKERERESKQRGTKKK